MINQEPAQNHLTDLKKISKAFREINAVIDLETLLSGSNMNFFILQVPGIMKKIQAKQNILTPMIQEVLKIIKNPDYES